MEQLRCYGLLNGGQGRILVSGKRRRRVVRIAKRNQRCTFEIQGLNGNLVILELRLVRQPFCRIRQLLAKKLLRLHPAYSRHYLRQRALPQLWCDYNHLLSRHAFPLVGYDEWIQRVEYPAILEEQYKLATPVLAESNRDVVNCAIWLWGDRDDDRCTQMSIDSLNRQATGSYRVLPEEYQLQEGDSKTWVILLQVGDQLPSHAMRRIVTVIQAHPDARVLYADEDRISLSGRRSSPQFKPAWNPDLLYSDASYSHSWVIRSDLCSRACQALQAAGEETTLYSLVLEITSNCRADQILHLPEILYHRLDRSEETRSSAQTAAALAAFFARHAQPLRVSFHPSGGHVVHWPLPNPPPLVSVIIPTRDHGDLLRCCLTSLAEHAQANPPTEIIVIDNGSSEPETLAYLADLEEHNNVRLLRRPGPFNYSSLNNEAVSMAKGELIALMNNDVEATHGGWLATMAAQALRPEIGAVGAKLLFEDGTIQHAGILLGIGGVAGHAHKYLDANAEGYQFRLQFAHNVSAVTAATLVMRRSLFLEVGGFDAETFAVNYNDVDLCLRLLMAGYRNLFCPDAVLVHHESKSRGAPTEKAAFQQWQRERQAMLNRWAGLLNADPNYSPHLSLQEENLSLSLRSTPVGARTARPSPLL
ncbi:MAG: glycosyltransferase family 2 protein [Cyanobacteriota bacterium]|nr:glycosyltransferase family 2 protein [Cyanobacteriota bacterium]